MIEDEHGIIQHALGKKKEYLTRQELMESIEFPENNDGLVFIPSNPKGTGFLRTHYDERYLSAFLSREEHLKVLDQASRLMATEFSKKRQSDTAGIP